MKKWIIVLLAATSCGVPPIDDLDPNSDENMVNYHEELPEDTTETLHITPRAFHQFMPTTDDITITEAPKYTVDKTARINFEVGGDLTDYDEVLYRYSYKYFETLFELRFSSPSSKESDWTTPSSAEIVNGYIAGFNGNGGHDYWAMFHQIAVIKDGITYSSDVVATYSMTEEELANKVEFDLVVRQPTNWKAIVNWDIHSDDFKVPNPTGIVRVYHNDTLYTQIGGPGGLKGEADIIDCHCLGRVFRVDVELQGDITLSKYVKVE